MSDHTYVIIENNGGCCSCGAYISWMGIVTTPGMAMAAHITEVISAGGEPS